jgi:hypothetical protein
VNTPKFEALFAEQGAATVTSTPEEYRKSTEQYIVRYGEIMRAVGIKAE